MPDLLSRVAVGSHRVGVSLSLRTSTAASRRAGVRACSMHVVHPVFAFLHHAALALFFACRNTSRTDQGVVWSTITRCVVWSLGWFCSVLSTGLLDHVTKLANGWHLVTNTLCMMRDSFLAVFENDELFLERYFSCLTFSKTFFC